MMTEARRAPESPSADRLTRGQTRRATTHHGRGVAVSAGRLILVLLSLVGGCADSAVRETPVQETPKAIWEKHRRELLALEHWSLRGRIGVQHVKEGWHASITWRQHGERFDLRIIAPLGRGTFRLAGDRDLVELTDPQGDTYRARDVAALMSEHLGWHLPVDGARYWVLGTPSEADPVENINVDAQGLLKDLAQSGWRISLSGYSKQDDIALPGKLFMIQGDVRVHMVIAAWALGER